MRVALVCPYDMGKFGGVQNQVALIGDELRRRGHDAWVVAPGMSNQPMRSLGKSRSWSFNDSAAPIKLSPLLVPRLRDALADADVVHVHEPLMPLASLACRWTGKPLVGTFHADPGRLVRTLYDRFPPLRWHLASFRSLVAVSETARSALGRFGDVVLIPNGVATADLPVRDRVDGRIVFVGRDDPRKGLDVAVAALDEIRKRRPAAHLLVITPDPVAAGDGIIVHRGVADATKAELLATAMVYVAPNSRGESFGLTVAEAMAAGTACVVSDIPAFAAVTGDAALRVPPGSPDDLTEAVLALLADPARRTELGERGRQRAHMFSIENTVDAYLPLYAAATV